MTVVMPPPSGGCPPHFLSTEGESSWCFLFKLRKRTGQLWCVFLKFREILKVEPLGNPIFAGYVGMFFGLKIRQLHSPGGYPLSAQ
jgi:hypothetical protein